MLGELLNARSDELVQLLKLRQPDLAALRQLALQMKITTESMMEEKGYLNCKNKHQETKTTDSVIEPASVESIVDMCAVAAQHRLKNLNSKFHPPAHLPSDLFVNGNPWELAYALLMAVMLCSQFSPSQGPRFVPLSHLLNTTPPVEEVFLFCENEVDFIDIIVSTVPSNKPTFKKEKDSSHGQSATIDSSHWEHPKLEHAHGQQTASDLENEWAGFSLQTNEWHILKKLAARNNAHIQTQRAQHCDIDSMQIVLRLPTFQPGHEEPLDFLNINEV